MAYPTYLHSERNVISPLLGCYLEYIKLKCPDFCPPIIYNAALVPRNSPELLHNSEMNLAPLVPRHLDCSHAEILIFYESNDLQNVAVEWLARLFRTRKVPRSNFGPDIGCAYWEFCRFSQPLQVNSGTLSRATWIQSTSDHHLYVCLPFMFTISIYSHIWRSSLPSASWGRATCWWQDWLLMAHYTLLNLTLLTVYPVVSVAIFNKNGKVTTLATARSLFVCWR